MKEKKSSWLTCRLTLFDQGCCKRRQCHSTHWTQLTLQEPTGCIFPQNSFERESFFPNSFHTKRGYSEKSELKRGKLPHFYNTVSERPFKTKSSFKRKYIQLLYTFTYFGTWFGREKNMKQNLEQFCTNKVRRLWKWHRHIRGQHCVSLGKATFSRKPLHCLFRNQPSQRWLLAGCVYFTVVVFFPWCVSSYNNIVFRGHKKAGMAHTHAGLFFVLLLGVFFSVVLVVQAFKTT